MKSTYVALDRFIFLDAISWYLREESDNEGNQNKTDPKICIFNTYSQSAPDSFLPKHNLVRIEVSGLVFANIAACCFSYHREGSRYWTLLFVERALTVLIHPS